MGGALTKFETAFLRGGVLSATPALNEELDPAIE